MNKFSLCILFITTFFFRLSLVAQEKEKIRKITAKFLAKDSKVDFAYTNVDVYYGNIFISNILINSKGEFEISIVDSVKSLTLKSLVFEEFNIDISNFIKPGNLFLGNQFVTLKNNLNEVVVTAKELGKFSIDKRVYKVKELQNSNIPILKNFISTLPSVVSRNDVFFVDGRKKVVFYLNGVLISDAAAQNLALDLLQSVEIITAPSAFGIKIENDKSIINLISKKNENIKLGGNLSSDIGILRNLQAFSVNNYLAFKENFLNVNLNQYNNNYNQTKNSFWKNNQNNALVLSEASNAKYSVVPLFCSIFSQIQLSKNIVFITSIDLDKQSTSFNNSTEISANDNLIDTKYVDKKRDYFINSQLKYTIDSLSYFTADLSNFNNFSKQEIDSNYGLFNISSIDTSKFSNINARFIYYLNSKNKKAHFENGIIYSNYSTDFSLKQVNISTDVSSFKNLINSGNYKTTIFGFFSKFKRDLNIGSIALGLSAEALILTSQDVTKEYLEAKLRPYFFPEFTYFLETKKHGTLLLNIDRNITLPNTNNINPTQRMARPNQIKSGNNGILPEISNNFQVYNFSNIKNIEFVSNIYFINTKNLIDSDGFQTAADNVLQSKTQNIGKSSVFGTNVSMSINKKVINQNFNFRIENYRYLMNINSNLEETMGFQFELDYQSTIPLNKTTDINLNLNYKNINYSPSLLIFYKGPSMSININRTIKKKINLKLNWSSIFNFSNKQNFKYSSKFVDGQGNEFTNLQNLTFSCTYNFGKIFDKKDSNLLMQPRKIKK